MNSRFAFLFAALLGVFASTSGHAQQQPVLTVSITDVAVLSGGGKVAFIDITNVGSVYQVPPVVTITPDPHDLTGSGASAVATTSLAGTVSSIRITNPGSNYALPPTITLTPPTGTNGIQAQAIAYLGTHFPQPTQNESYGPAGVSIAISALAVGTFPASGFTYEYFVNGISIGVAAVHPPAGTPAAVGWTPPQPGAYFLTVKASDGAHEAVSLPVRYFAVGTMITSPTPNTIVPKKSSVVLQATATPQPLLGLQGGSGYSTPPTVTISGGGGSGATATTTITPGVTQITVSNGGTGYTGQPAVSIAGGGGSGAVAIANVANGVVTSVEVTNHGAGYTSVPTVSIAAPAGGGITAAATATVSVVVDTITLVTPGSGYTTPPVVTLSGGGGSGANAVALIDSNTGLVTGLNLTGSNTFVQRIDFYSDDQLIGSDSTAPYSLIYTPPDTPATHTIEARAFDNNGRQVSPNGTAVQGLSMVPPIGTPPLVTISSPANNAIIPIPSGSAVDIPIAVSAGSPTGLITKVELYIDGVLAGTAVNFPYRFTWHPTVVGDFHLIALAYDDKSNVVASSIAPASTAIRIRASPTVTLISPVPGDSAALGLPTQLTAAATDSNIGGAISLVEFYVNDKLVGVSDTAGGIAGNEYSVSWTPTAAGSASITAKAFNLLGIPSDSAPVVMTVTDGGGGGGTTVGKAPTVALTSPVNSARLAVNQATLLTAAAADEDGNIVSLEFFVGGKSLGSSGYPYSLAWTPNSLGLFVFTAKATDNDGNVVTSSPVSVTVVDPSPNAPSVSIAVVGGTSVVSGNPTTIQADATDDVSVASVQFFVNGVAFGEADLTFPFSTSWTPSSPGSYTITARATDNAGNQTMSSPLRVTVSAGSAPTVSLTSPNSSDPVGVGTPVNLAAQAGDADGTVVSVRFLVDGIVVGTATTAPYVSTWVPTAAGSYSLVAQVTDNAGNIANSPVRPLSVYANLLPLPKLTSPVNNAVLRVGVAATLTATATDLDGTIASVQFFANGKVIGTTTTPPYKIQWTPTAEGTWRLTALAVDNAGGVGTSRPVLVTTSVKAADTVETGTYQGNGEAGNFALVASLGNAAAFIGYSTQSNLKKTYFYPNVPVDVSGGYNLDDSAGHSLISGLLGETGTSGTLAAGLQTFIGIDTGFLATGNTATAGYYRGKLTSHATSTLAAIVGEDGSIMLYVVDGSFDDAAGGGLAGKLNSAGAFSVVSMRGNRFAGTIDATTGILTGTLSGANGGAFTASQTPLGNVTSSKVAGAATEVVSNVFVAANNNTFDQVLLQGTSASVMADPGQVTRLSYEDLSGDIVQVEFSGAGKLTLALENASGPAQAANYNQPDVHYMKGHAGIVITGADATTNVSIFSVGRLTAVNQALFKSGVTYDGVADVSYLVIMSADGKFGGVRAANAAFVASQGIAGLCAPGVEFTGPIYVGDINASDAATAMLMVGRAGEVQINGGNLWQPNGRAVQVGGFDRLKFVNGTTSQGVVLPAQKDRSRLEQDGVDVTSQLVVNPTP